MHLYVRLLRHKEAVSLPSSSMLIHVLMRLRALKLIHFRTNTHLSVYTKVWACNTDCLEMYVAGKGYHVLSDDELKVCAWLMLYPAIIYSELGNRSNSRQ